MPSRAYKKGYSLERHCVLTLEYHGWHVKRNVMSVGIEDIMAYKDGKMLLIQCKNTKRGEKAMSEDELEILLKHALELKAMPMYVYKDRWNKIQWWNPATGIVETPRFKKYDMVWYRERMKMRKMLRDAKKRNPKEYYKYVLKNWDKVKDYIC